MSAYFEELCQAMALVAAQPRAVFMGQAVACPGTAMFNTLRDVPMAHRLELPVAEDMQMGMAIGAALAGDLPVCIYPRWNFLLLAMSQLVLHLDKLPAMGGGRPKVIIRTAIATDSPLDPGPQHVGNYTDAVGAMLQTVSVEQLSEPRDIVPAYKAALKWPGPTLLVEHMELY